MTRKSSILIVDDEQFVRESLVDLLQNEGFSTTTAGDVARARRIVETEAVDAVVTDLSLPDGDGIGLLRGVREQGMEIPVVLLTGVGTIPAAVDAMKAGAFDFVQKPVDPEQFVLLLRRALDHRDLVSEVTFLRGAVQDLQGSMKMVGSSAAFEAVRALIAQVARTDSTVLICGESGTGKELVGAEIHRLSARVRRNLVRVNCAAISESLFESEFFGHRRGAFTGAATNRCGRFEEADGGSLILDEIGTLRPEMQAKLLRVLESGEYQVVGESKTRVADVRVIAVTNEDLESRVRAGEFRSDLYYRLNVFPIQLPPLRERRDDIGTLANYFLRRLAERGSAGASEAARGELSEEAVEVLRAYDWPGNVRELKNIMERAMILTGAAIPEANLFRRLLGSDAGRPTSPEGEEPATEDLNLRRRVEALERRLIRAALTRSGGTKRQAAALLGIDPRNLSYYLKKHALTEGAGPEGSG